MDFQLSDRILILISVCPFYSTDASTFTPGDTIITKGTSVEINIIIFHIFITKTGGEGKPFVTRRKRMAKICTPPPPLLAPCLLHLFRMLHLARARAREARKRNKNIIPTSATPP